MWLIDKGVLYLIPVVFRKSLFAESYKLLKIDIYILDFDLAEDWAQNQLDIFGQILQVTVGFRKPVKPSHIQFNE